LDSLPDLSFMTVPYVVKSDPTPTERSWGRAGGGEVRRYLADDDYAEGTTTDDSEEWALFEAPPPASFQHDTSSDAAIAMALQAQLS
jgi:hypothetical protein